MNELQVFNSPEFGEIRTIVEDGKALFCGKDVAAALGYSDPKKAVARHCKGGTKRPLPTNGGIQEMIFIPVGDIYRLAARSELPGAEEFESWIFDEVLPSIFERGGYLTPETEKQLTEGLTAVTATVQTLVKGFESQAALTQRLTDLVEDLTRRVEAVEQGRNEMRALPPGGEGESSAPGIASQRRWMRTVSEKLDLMSAKFNKSNNAILHKIYKDMEEEFETVMEDERYRVMEEQGLEKCSVLTAIFFDEELRDYFQRYVDHNLAPENRGW